MKKYIVLLRGVNVSGKNKIPMAELRTLLIALDFKNVQTYIQSGNIILTSDLKKEAICKLIKKGILAKFGFDVPVLARTATELENAIKKYPFPIENTKIVAFVFLDQSIKELKIDVKGSKNDEYKIDNDMVYIYCPTSFANTKLSNNTFEKKLNVIATTRNYNTTLQLLALAKN